MGFNVNQGRGGTGQMATVHEKIWLTADKRELVPDGDERAAFLFATPGDQVPVEDAEKYGLVDGRLKAGKQAANKMAAAPDNKTVVTGEPFDPSSHTAQEVIAYVRAAERNVALAVLVAEENGKKRASVLAEREAIEQRESNDPPQQ